MLSAEQGFRPWQRKILWWGFAPVVGRVLAVSALFKDASNEPDRVSVAELGYHHPACHELSATMVEQTNTERRAEWQLPPPEEGKELVAGGVANQVRFDSRAVESSLLEVRQTLGVGQQALVVERRRRPKRDELLTIPLLEVG